MVWPFEVELHLQIAILRFNSFQIPIVIKWKKISSFVWCGFAFMNIEFKDTIATLFYLLGTIFFRKVKYDTFYRRYNLVREVHGEARHITLET